MRARHRSDSGEKDFADNLRRMGASVHPIESAGGRGVADYVVGYRGVCHLLERKRLGGRMRESQVLFVRVWSGCYHVATSSFDAFALIKECHERLVR